MEFPTLPNGDATIFATPAGSPPPRVEIGAVLYAPNSDKSSVLRAFAADLRARGWRIGGVSIDTLYGDAKQKSGLNLIDLASGDRIPFARLGWAGLEVGRWTLSLSAIEQAKQIILESARNNVDLLVVDKFGPLEGRGDGLAPALRAILPNAGATLVAVRSEFVEAWDQFSAELPGKPLRSALLRPHADDLWRWWGPERLWTELANATPGRAVDDVAIGAHWVCVSSEGGAGLAYAPSENAPGAARIERPEELRDQDLNSLSTLVHSDNPREAAIGWAAVSAWTNHPDELQATARVWRTDDQNGLDALAGAPGPTVVIGRFPSTTGVMKEAAVIERTPGPGNHPPSAAPRLLSGAGQVAVTASSLIDKGAADIVRQSPNARRVLVGPGAPLTPRLFAYGFHASSGLAIENTKEACRIVRADGDARDLRAAGRLITLYSDHLR